MDLHIHVGPITIQLLDGTQFNSLMTRLDVLERNLKNKMADLNSVLLDLQTKVTANTTVEQSAVTLLGGLSKMLSDALAAAAAAGATPAQLQGFTDAIAQVDANTQGLAAAVAANTPPAAPPVSNPTT